MVGNSSEGKLSDFGLALPTNTNPVSLGVKAYNYVAHLAPEVGAKGVYTEQADLYACGVTLYRLVNGDTFLPTVMPSEIPALAVAGTFPDRNRYRDFIPRSLRLVINRAMHPDVKKRFSSASELRHALERIPIHMNWDERVLPDGFQWTAEWNEHYFEVVRLMTGRGRWSVVVKKGRSKGSLRTNSRVSLDATTELQAKRHASRVLQDYVLGRLT